MLKYLRLFVLLLLLGTTSSLLNAAPSQDDDRAQQISIAITGNNADIPAIASAEIQFDELLTPAPDDGGVQTHSNATFSGIAAQNSPEVVAVRLFENVATSLKFFKGPYDITAGSRNLGARNQDVNTINNTVVGKNVICDYLVVANSANLANWTTNGYHDDAGQFFSFSNTTCAQNFLASALPEQVLRC